MPRRKKKTDSSEKLAADAKLSEEDSKLSDEGGAGEEPIPEDQLLCKLTQELRKVSPEEEVLQAFVDQLHREYRVELSDMARDLSFRISSFDESAGKNKSLTRKAALVVYKTGIPPEKRSADDIIRVVMIAKKSTRPENKKQGVKALDDLLFHLAKDRTDIYGAWTNGERLAFRMLQENPQNGYVEAVDLTDFPAPGETLEDLEDATRRPLRIATQESLLRSFKSAHDYLYGNQSMRGDRAFWQLLNLIFCKILDEQQSSRLFFVGATEANTPEGQTKVVERINRLFNQVKNEAYKDVFEGNERIELNDRALVFVATELSRYSLLGTDTDAKGLAYEAITSNTLKRERGQFFTPRNIIRMMVEMMDPGPEDRVLDPACGSGGFLVVVLNHVRRKFLAEIGADPDLPVPSERKRVENMVKNYARKYLWGVDVDLDLRKAARMNMVMNDDGHGNIFCFNSLEFGVPKLEVPDMEQFAKDVPGLNKLWKRRNDTSREFGVFDFIFTNPPFGAKIPITDPTVLSTFDLGHKAAVSPDSWVRASPQRKVSPEILFIESCCKYLKPGTGKMAIVLPDGILGNPGKDMEAVRAWMLREMELLASIDLPAEGFLPQVSVQASCVFLRRRHPDEFMGTGEDGLSQGPVFMAIAEKVGHGRRGEPVVMRGPDGRELLFEGEDRVRWEDEDGIHEESQTRKVTRIADDLPWIAEQYRKHVLGLPFEEE
ncbi:N-6 DNA methylase [Leptolyngbyaceae cyanobacterium CCMR0082]|uniref:N-6 DNA methylase n=1 Tax=Adonisia turfae CCMR0082 TaxID=2304604 RepID=A0A6M0S855_9CYAN|nr:N-6 DNA methylase [Adonisia turfae]NEZ64674.1 N-6 DNA methylase [Adonisia turfae CCMR0082]